MQHKLVTPSEKTWLQRALERQHGKPIETLLRELYVDQTLTVREVGEALHVDPGAISRWMRDYGIPARSKSGKAA